MTEAADVDQAARILRAGGLVAFPTETVYGLGADATNPEALKRIFAVKGRPADHPVIVHMADTSDIDRYGADVSPAARDLAEAFWPGPLTIIVRRNSSIANEVTGGRDTVGLRVPDQPLALAMLRAFDGPVAAPSANRFGRVSPTEAQHVRDDLGDDVGVVLDGGPCRVGVESTIVEMIDEPMILRHGSVTTEQLEKVLGRRVHVVASGPSRASGMLPSHYAPRANVVVIADRELAAMEAHRLGGELLDPQASTNTWARELYRWLREADRRGVANLIVVPPPANGLGIAVLDRLTKASAPRPV